MIIVATAFVPIQPDLNDMAENGQYFNVFVFVMKTVDIYIFLYSAYIVSP